jgi:hypothetical protein
LLKQICKMSWFHLEDQYIIICDINVFGFTSKVIVVRLGHCCNIKVTGVI